MCIIRILGCHAPVRCTMRLCYVIDIFLFWILTPLISAINCDRTANNFINFSNSQHGYFAKLYKTCCCKIVWDDSLLDHMWRTLPPKIWKYKFHYPQTLIGHHANTNTNMCTNTIKIFIIKPNIVAHLSMKYICPSTLIRFSVSQPTNFIMYMKWLKAWILLMSVKLSMTLLFIV